MIKGNPTLHLNGRETEGNLDESSLAWMIPLSTLMVILMALFIALYGFSHYSPMQYETALGAMGAIGTKDGKGAVDSELALAQNMKQFIEDMRMEGLAEVIVTPHAIKLKLSSPVIFDTGSAELKPDIMPLLVRLYGHMKQMRNTIIVEGHTDNVPVMGGLYRSNLELSAARAFSVIKFFIERGIEPERLVAHGYGEYRPFFPNTTELGRAINRRIEITIMRGGAK